MTDRMTIPTANMGVFGHAQLEETDLKRLRQRLTTGNDIIDVLGPGLQFLVVVCGRNHVATLYRVRHHQKSRICRWNFDEICHSFADISTSGNFAAIFTAQCTLVHLRGLAIACRLSVRPSVRPSVCPSVTLVICNHIDWKSWKLIARSINLTPSLFVARRRSTYS